MNKLSRNQQTVSIFFAVPVAAVCFLLASILLFLVWPLLPIIAWLNYETEDDESSSEELLEE